MAVNRKTMTQAMRQKAQVGRVVDATTADLIVAWARAWDEVAASLEELLAKELTTAGRLRARRQRQALELISRRLLALAESSGVRVSEDARRLVAMSLAHQGVLIGTQMPPGMSVQLSRPDAAQVEAIVKRSTEQITSRTLQLHAEAEQQMRRELARSVAVGDNPREAARRMVQGLRQPFDGGLTRALVIARTENLDAYRAAAQTTQDANRDVLAGWRWVASLSRRTCPSCVAHHGELHSLDEPGPEDHHQGRCARVPVTKSWAELGFHGISEPGGTLRDGDGVRWLESQPAEVQRDVFGPKRYEAYKAGDYGPEKWSERHENDGWRPSWHVGKV